MNTGPATNTDQRMIAAGLAANVAMGRPMLISATGRETPSRYVAVPRNAWVPFALLPHTDYVDDPDQRPGCGFVGGRVASIAPLLPPGAIPAAADLAVTLRKLPNTDEAILRDLRSRAGLCSAPGALFARTAWPDTFVATWLDGLRENGDRAQLSCALGQASLGLRKMWLAVEWGVGAHAETSLPTAAGVVAVGRALIDAVAVVDRLAAPERHGRARLLECEAALGALLTALHHYVRHVRAADGEDDPAIVGRKLQRAISWARNILDAVGVFAVADDPSRKRWERLTSMLDIGRVRDHAGGAAETLDRLSRELEKLASADLGRRLDRTGWRPHIRRALLRLAIPDRHVRLVLLARVRCDLIFVLAATRQLERLYRLFPWLAAPHGAFPGCAGGALGALASLYEAARASLEIGGDMKRRLADTGIAGQQQLGFGTAVTSSAALRTLKDGQAMVHRVTPKNVAPIYASPVNLVRTAGRNYAAGAALVQQVTSHVMVKAALEGQTFGEGLSLEALRFGYLGYNDAAALRVRHTREAVLVIQQAQPAFHTSKRDDDLIRHMGLTLLRHLAAAVYSIWPTSGQRTDFAIHRVAVHTGRKPHAGTLKDKHLSGPWNDIGKYHVHQELVRSMLRAIDDGDDGTGVLRDPVTAIRTSSPGAEAGRAARLRNQTSRKTGSWEEQEEGQSAVRYAAHELTTSGERGKVLRELVDDVRLCRGRDPDAPRPAPQDDLLEDILLGRANLAQLAPVSDLPIPILWFSPLIDRDRLAWIGSGMPGQDSGDDQAPRAARMKSWIAAVRAWSPPAFAARLARGPDDAIACHLFTGVSSITADLGHVL